MTDGNDDEELIRRALRGDRAATRILAARVDHVLQARARAFLRLNPRPWSTDDMVASVWVKLLHEGGKPLLKWRRTLGRSLESYVALIAWGRWINQLTHELTQKAGGGKTAALEHDPHSPDGAPSAESLLISNAELQQLLQHLMKVLPPRGVVVLRLVFTFELSPAECAQVLQDSVQNVHNWIFRIREAARAYRRAQTELAAR